VDPRDAAEIGAACLRIVSNPVLRAELSNAALDNIHKYSWSRYAQDSVSLYASLSRKPRLLAADIDNTLTGCRAGARAFTQWHAAYKMKFVVATGRSFEAARLVLAEWNLPQPDAFIVDVGTRIVMPTARGRWRACEDYAATLEQGWDRRAVRAALTPLGLTAQPPETETPYKLSFFGTASQAKTIAAVLVQSSLGARVIFSHERLIDVLAPRAGKAAALAWYAERHGLTLGDCIAAGDSGNDLDMLEAAGCAIAVGNCSSELDPLLPRPGLLRVAGRYATGVLEGLAEFGLAPPQTETAAA
jgi:sucrose-phosphate synthase